MTEPFRIESATNPKVKTWRQLRKRPARDATGSCLIEGGRELARALAGRVRLEAVLTAVDAAPSELELAEAAARSGADHFELGAAALGKVSVRRHPAGIIGVAETPAFSLESVELGPAPLLLVADSLEKPGNIGAMLRTAEAAGVDAVVVVDAPTDLVNPNVIRASQGSVFTMQVAALDGDSAAKTLQQMGIRTVAATPDASPRLWELDLTGPLAIVVGSEHRGVSSRWRAGGLVSIPMMGMADSLNASVAAAVVLYEAIRQRR